MSAAVDARAAANPARGEAALTIGGRDVVLRPSFQNLVAAEGELGPLFGLVERAAEGKLTLGEIAALFWHCLHEAPEKITRDEVGEALIEAGLAAVLPALKRLLGQVLAGR